MTSSSRSVRILLALWLSLKHWSNTQNRCYLIWFVMSVRCCQFCVSTLIVPLRPNQGNAKPFPQHPEVSSGTRLYSQIRWSLKHWILYERILVARSVITKWRSGEISRISLIIRNALVWSQTLKSELSIIRRVFDQRAFSAYRLIGEETTKGKHGLASCSVHLFWPPKIKEINPRWPYWFITLLTLKVNL